MTIREFLEEVFTTAAASPLCGIPNIRRLTASAINIRIPIVGAQFVDAFFNEVTG